MLTIILVSAGVFLITSITILLFFIKKRKEKQRKPRIIISPPSQSVFDTGKIKLSQTVAKLVVNKQYQEAMDLAVAQGDFRAAGRVALRMGQPLRAAEYFERTKDYESAANAYLKIPDFRRAAGSFALCKMHERAAEIYMQIGDHYAAAEQWLSAGKPDKAVAIHRMLGNETMAAKIEGELFVSQKKWIEAARAFEIAGETERVAKCLEMAGLYKESASVYKRMGKLDKAAQMLEKIGALVEAAATYEEAQDHQEAARIYKTIKNPEREIDALKAAGQILEAGLMAYKIGNKEKAEAILLEMAPADKGFGRACFLLGKIMEETGRDTEALKYYARFVERTIPSESNRSAFEYLAKIFEKNGLYDVSFMALRKLHAEDLLRPEMSPLLERVTQQLSLAQAKFGSSQNLKTQESSEEEIPQKILERYEVVKRLGEGGTAVVYLARDKILMRDVVLKFLANPSLPADLAREYFMREAQIVAGMSHPNITTVYDIGSAEGRYYIVMEYIEGNTLADILHKCQGRPMKLKEIMTMIQDIAQALEYAHKRQIIHRDIKPGNIMVMSDGHAKLMDFGMAKALQIHKDRSIYICGTLDYMSLEQEAGFDLTPATDIYSFGLVILECLLGVLPCGATSQLSRQLRLEALEKSELPEGVKKVIISCLDVDINKRPTSAIKIVEELSKFIDQ